jgi:hypothetical protein
MLDSHPELTIPPETHFIPKVVKAVGEGDDGVERGLEVLTTHRRWPDFQLEPDDLRARLAPIEAPTATDLMRAFYSAYAQAQGKSRWGDKTPSYVRRMRKISRVLPEAHFVHLIRDGRDVALSQLEVHHGADDLRQAAEAWVAAIGRAREHARRLPHYLEFRYEDLVDQPEAVLRRVCDFVELPFDAVMLEYHRGAEERMAETVREFERGQGKGPPVPAELRARQHERVSQPPQRQRAGRWRTDMSAEDRAAFEEIAGERLAELGYEVGVPTR